MGVSQNGAYNYVIIIIIIYYYYSTYYGKPLLYIIIIYDNDNYPFERNIIIIIYNPMVNHWIVETNPEMLPPAKQ